jgi:hypothetical protein
MTLINVLAVLLVVMIVLAIAIPVVHRWLRQWLTALKPCRFSILLVLAGLLFLILVPQGQDVLRSLAERQRGNADEWTRFFFFATALLWSLSAWYWAEVMLKLAVPNVPGHVPELQTFRIWLPRVIGAVAAFGLGVAFYKAASGYSVDAAVRRSLQLYALSSALGGVLFLVATAARRPLARLAYERLRAMPVMQGRLAAPVLDMLDLKPASETVYGAVASIMELAPLTRRILIFMILLAVALFFVFVFAVQSVAPLLGAAAILLLAASGWIAVGSALDAYSMRQHVPVFTLLIVVAVVFSLWNDNHRVHELKGLQPETWETRTDVRKALSNWLNDQTLRMPRTGDAKIPLYLVDAEGGGIRAAWWTATVLGEIQKQNPCFADQLFSMSGVSGGSLGVAVFNALLADAPNSDNGFRCDRHGKPVADTSQVQASAQNILDHDFLSPVMAGLLYTDLAQRFWPRPIAALDRGRILEEAFERAWELETKSNRLAEPLDNLWQRKDVWMPALLLNATWVETGKRMIASNLRLQPRGSGYPEDKEDFVDIEDTNRFFRERALALSTAVHLSARFTYVSPAGTLVKDGTVQGHAVDGGYFENSGATTTHEILKAIDQLTGTDPAWKRVRVVVIHISNEPVDPAYPAGTLETGAKNKATRPLPLLNETLSPLLAIVNTRSARGEYARSALRWHTSNTDFLHFGLCKEEEALPLGWVLSNTSQKRMNDQLTKERCLAINDGDRVIFDNPNNLCELRKQIAGRFAAPGAKLEACN